jgi:hypothetical protein
MKICVKNEEIFLLVVRRHGDKRDHRESTRMHANCTRHWKSGENCTLFIRNNSWPTFFLRVSVVDSFELHHYPFSSLE